MGALKSQLFEKQLLSRFCNFGQLSYSNQNILSRLRCKSQSRIQLIQITKFYLLNSNNNTFFYRLFKVTVIVDQLLKTFSTHQSMRASFVSTLSRGIQHLNPQSMISAFVLVFTNVEVSLTLKKDV